ncbi:uncharacterized metal-dependent hydrolase BU355-like [Saccostrea cucullata]|uniref:uncharacterized metal-dependent hydrolase BU355-like n=1 Tax=Saccostrea cuccullata TaxID=36930 RepID=UPI002ED1C436
MALTALTEGIAHLPVACDVPVQVVGGCAVYVDGSTPPTDTTPEPGWVTAVGFHPTQVAGVTAGNIESLVARCVENGWVIGEVGLDYVKGSNWGHQRWVLGEFCRLATPLTPLVLHLRGASSDPMGQEPLLDCQQLLDQARTPLWVPLYLQPFTGGASKVDEWLDTGRVVFYGVSGLIQYFTWGQIQGVRRIPTDRLLIETDSSHLGVG